MYIYTYTCIHTHANTHTYIYTTACVYTYAYIYIYTHMYVPGLRREHEARDKFRSRSSGTSSGSAAINSWIPHEWQTMWTRVMPAPPMTPSKKERKSACVSGALQSFKAYRKGGGIMYTYICRCIYIYIDADDALEKRTKVGLCLWSVTETQSLNKGG